MSSRTGSKISELPRKEQVDELDSLVIVDRTDTSTKRTPVSGITGIIEREVAKETTQREDVDNMLGERIDANVTAISNNTTAIANEPANRNTAITDAISVETSAREGVDSVLATRIDNGDVGNGTITEPKLATEVQTKLNESGGGASTLGELDNVDETVDIDNPANTENGFPLIYSGRGQSWSRFRLQTEGIDDSAITSAKLADSISIRKELLHAVELDTDGDIPEATQDANLNNVVTVDWDGNDWQPFYIVGGSKSVIINQSGTPSVGKNIRLAIFNKSTVNIEIPGSSFTGLGFSWTKLPTSTQREVATGGVLHFSFNSFGTSAIDVVATREA